MRPRPWHAAIIAASIAAAVAIPGVAQAHTALQSSDPGEEQIVTKPVDHVSLTFTSAVSPSGNTILVTDQAGHGYTTGASTGTRSTVTQPVTPLPTGIYTIAYRVFAADGNPTTGTVTFTVHLPGDPAPTAAPRADSGAPGSGSAASADPAPMSKVGIFAGALGAAAALAALVLFGVARRRAAAHRRDTA